MGISTDSRSDSDTRRTHRRTYWWCPVIVIALSTPVLMLIIWPVTATRGAARDTECKNYLHQLGLALHNYHDEHGSFPPAFVVDVDGQPMHGWRTLILRFVDHAPLYDQYHFDEPWNGPHNRTLHEKINVSTRGCPSDPEVYRAAAGTSYAAVVGPDTAWPGDRAMMLAHITDDPENTILLVEVSPAFTNWFEPRDLDFESMSFRINDPDQPSLSSHHATEPSWPWGNPVPYVHVLMVDGSVKRLPVSTPPETIRSLLTVAGGEKIDVEWIED
jgi:hypothetical protein